MIPRTLACFLLVFSINTALRGQDKSEAPVKATVCQLKSDPAAYEHKLVEVTGFVMTGGREDFNLFDPACPEYPDVDLEDGGSPIENIPTRLVEDARFKQFSDLLYREGNKVAHATIIGRFFAGKLVQYASGVRRKKHDKLAIERIVSVDPHRSKALDYAALTFDDQPETADKTGCGYTELTEMFPTAEMVQAQEKADRGEDEWVFTDPKRVATSGLAQLLTVDENSIKLKLKRRAQGRFVYEWRPKTKSDYYVVVVNRPYLASFYAKNPNRVAWMLRAAYEAGCGENKAVRRIN
jgi:hypothetical protein